MSHRGTGHAARRRLCGFVYRSQDRWLEDGLNGSHVSREWDATTYDDVIPHRLRAAPRLADDGEPATLTDLVADVRVL